MKAIQILLLWSALSSTSVAYARLFSAPVIFPRLQCFLRFQRFDYAIGNFERYGEYFRDDSTMGLAQAGLYYGADGIEEYVKFVYGEYSEYLEIPTRTGQSKVTFRGYDRDSGECVFLLTRLANVKFNEANARNGDELSEIDMLKIKFNYSERYISEISVFFTEPFLSLFFGYFLNSDNTRNYICSVYEGNCNGNIDYQPADCVTELAALEVSTGNARFDGYTQGCRVLHSMLASTNKDHCPHLSFEPMEDKGGKIKCHFPDTVEPEDLFDAEDFKIWEEYCIEMGFDPAIGHDYNTTGLVYP